MSVKRYGMTLLGFAILVVLTFALAACGAAEEVTTTAETTAAETTETESMDDESMASEDEMDDMDDESMASEDEMMDESDDSMAESDLTEAMETDLGIQTYSADIDASKQRVHFTDPAVTPPDRDSIIRVRSWDYTCFDSHTLGCSGSLSSMLFNTLTQWYENPAEPLVVGDPRPLSELAESWSFPSSDTIQFTLRQGVKFHDVEPVNGREMVADDVVYSFQRGMLPDAPRGCGVGRHCF